jgi:apolipoprotein N-acyltransferase
MVSRYPILLLAFALNFVAVGGKWNVPLAAWIVPVLALRFCRRSDKPWLDFLLLWLATAIPLIVSQGGATFFPRLGEVGFFFAIAPVFVFPFVIDRYFHQRFPTSALMLFIFPIAATAFDFLMAGNSPVGSFGASAYSQRGFPLTMQIASVFGIWGITFVISLFATVVNQFWERNASPVSWTAAGSLVFILLLCLGRILLPAQPEQTVVIAGFSLPDGTLSNSRNQFRSGDEAGFVQAMAELHAAELTQIRKLARDGANIVVLQEGGVVGTTAQINTMIVDVGTLAKEESVFVVLPAFDVQQSPPVNSVYIVDPNGDMVLHHVKYGGNIIEGTLKGDQVLQTLDTPYGKISTAICWDADYPAIIKQAGAQGVDLLIIPAQDWLAVRDLHAGMATFRAVENGLTIFRQTGQGVSIVSNPYGKVLSRVDSFEDTSREFVSVMKASVPITSVNTFYPNLGDALGQGMLLALLPLFVVMWVIRKKPLLGEAG